MDLKTGSNHELIQTFYEKEKEKKTPLPYSLMLHLMKKTTTHFCVNSSDALMCLFILFLPK